ncbi:MAG: EamA family transporter [Clostridia bacterium]|nr:EamA family transporter [Clostridia bacterium]
MNEKKHFLQKTWVVALMALLCCVLWGSATPCIKKGYEIFGIVGNDYMSTILFAGIRFILAGVLTVLIGSFIAKKPLFPSKATLKYVLALSLVQTVIQYVFFYIGHAYASGVTAAIVNGSNVFIAILVAAFVFRTEKMTVKKAIGCVLGFAGVIVVSLAKGDMGFTVMGAGFILMAALAYAFSSVMIKMYSKHENPVTLSGWQFFIGGIIMTVFALPMGGKFDIAEGGALTATALLFYMACISAVAYSIWGLLMKYNDVSKVSIFGPFNPISGVILSAIILGEWQSIGIEVVLALVLVALGILVVNYKKR